jgi:hypothetical protein
LVWTSKQAIIQRWPPSSAYHKLGTVNNCFHPNLPEVNQMSKARDTKKSEKKKPLRTAKEKKQAKREKKNK